MSEETNSVHKMPAKMLKPNYKAKKSRHAPPREQHRLQFLSDDTAKVREFLHRLQGESNDFVPLESPIFHEDLDGSLASVTQGRVISDAPPLPTFTRSNTTNFMNTSSEMMGRRMMMQSEYESRYSDGKPSCSSLVKPSRPTLDHIMAERKRREKLNQRFIDLSAVIPGLTKLDKATVLGDAIKYVKQLEGKVKDLQNQIPKTIFRSVKRAKELSLDCQISQAQEDSTNANAEHTAVSKSLESFPEIDIRLVDNAVLIKVHCARKKGMIEKIFSELEELHLHVSSAQILSFPSTELDLTFMGQVEDSYNVTVDSIMQALQALLKSFN